MKKVIFNDLKLIFPLFLSVSSWHIKYFFKRPFPISCSFYITNKCNFRCVFCNIWRNKEKFELSLNESMNLLNFLGKKKCFYFSISGGEPLLAKETLSILNYAKKMGIAYTHMVTNGSLLTKDVALDLQKVGLNEISISLDGASKVHNGLRKKNDAYEKVFLAIDNLKTHAPLIKIVVNNIFNPLDIKSSNKVIDITKELDVELKFQPINEHPKFDGTNYTVKKITDKQLNKKKVKENVIDFIKNIRNQKHVVNSKNFSKNIYNYFYQNDKLAFNNKKCILGYHHIEIFNKQVFPCLEANDWKNGFDLEKGIENIIGSTEYKEQIEKLYNCEKCSKNMYICYYEPRFTFPVWNFLKYL